MKAKKFIAAIALTLAATTLAACTDSDQSVEFNNYWNYNSLVLEEMDETLEYDVVFEKGAGMELIDYTLAYSEGSYVTHLKSDETQSGVYRYTTDFSIKVTYTYNGESVVKEDSVKTEVVFRDANNGLLPVSSEKWIVSHSPRNGDVSKLDDCYGEFRRHIKTVYDENKNATCTVSLTYTYTPEVVSTKTFSANGGKYSYLDNEQLLVGLRAISTSVTSAKVQFYNAFQQTKQTAKLSFSTEEDGAEFSYLDLAANPDATEKTKKTIPYREVTITLDATNPGSTQTAWLAKNSTPEKNTYRNMLLKLETPLSYNLGKLVYSLRSVKR